MTAEEFKNLLDNEIVEYLNTHTLPVDDKWLNHPSYKPIWSQEFWEKYVDVYYLRKINMILANNIFYKDFGVLQPEFVCNYADDSEVDDACISSLFTDLFFKCFVLNADDEGECGADETAVDGHVHVDLEKITNFFKYCGKDLKGLHYTNQDENDCEENKKTDFDSLLNTLTNKPVDEYGFFIDYNTLEDCEENGYIDFSGDEFDYGPADTSKIYCAMKYYFAKYVWNALEGERVNYLKLIAKK